MNTNVGYTCSSQPDRVSSNTILNLTYILSSGGVTSTCVSPCANTILESNPNSYFSFNKFINDLQKQEIATYSEIIVTILLTKSAAAPSLAYFTDTNVTDVYALRLFERVSSTLTI